ncbi:MAG: hypothetical protein BZ151_09505 [Desulfobacca sp. 4484_104]|nr:MAG: hypothetical protein BZ151_09505 [Desulfobacca sp. 4484_104]
MTLTSTADHRKGALSLILVIILVLGWSSPAAAWLFHATRRAAARSILRRGVNPAKLHSKARFGSGLYLSRRRSTALAEKGASSAVVKFKSSRALDKRTVDFRQPTSRSIKARLGNSDLRGAIKKSIIGPKLGRKLGRWGGKQGKVIEYRSAQTGGSNLVIPKQVLQKHPNLVRSISAR